MGSRGRGLPFTPVLVVAFLTGCSPDSGKDTTANGSTGAAADGATLPEVSTESAWVPGEFLLRRGACPFECCLYREWTAETAIPVMAREKQEGASPIFTISPGETFDADSGNVHITEVARVAVIDSVADEGYWSFVPGDTLGLLDHIGEGHYNVYFDGRVMEVDGFWGPARQPAVARLLGEPRSEWWVHVTTADGRRGWILMNDSVEVRGADGCA